MSIRRKKSYRRLYQHSGRFRGAVYGQGGGGKGGGGDAARAAQEAPNTLRSKAVARFIDILSEGEIVGLADTENPAKSIYLDGTPLQSENGTFNFSGVKITQRYGLPDQDPVPGYVDTEREVGVGIDVTVALGPAVQTIQDPNVDAARVTIQFDALFAQNKSNGDVNGTSVAIRIEVQENLGSYILSQEDTISGKTNSPYERSYYVPLPKNFGGAPWNIKVTRLTGDAPDLSIVDKFRWSRYTEVIEKKFIFPDSAYIAVEADSQFFGGNIPQRSYRVKGRKINIPDIYYPEGPDITNGLLQSNGLDQAEWTKTGSTVVKNALSVSNVFSAEQFGHSIRETATTGLHGVSQDSATTYGDNAIVVASIYMKDDTRHWGVIRVTKKDGTTVSAWYDLQSRQTGTVESGGVGSVEEIGAGIVRCVLKINDIGVGASPTTVFFGAASADNTISYAGTAGSGVYMFGAQIIADKVAGLYLKTTTDPVTKNDTTRMRYYSSDVWLGDFRTAWSDNPAWVLYDMLINRRYGCGEAISAEQIDHFKLFEIAKYCDELVDDGFGGLEPRYSFHGVLQTREDAIAVLQSMASAFRGMVFWSAGSVSATQDAPIAASKIVTTANVENGLISYSGTGLKARHNSAYVSWNDPDDLGRQAIEVVENHTDIALRGHNVAEITAIGCYSRGLAHRIGKWLLDTEENESDAATWMGGMYFADASPGEIAKVIDPTIAGVRRGGRLKPFVNNLFIWSEDFGNAVWQRSNIVVIPGDEDGPDGSKRTADGLVVAGNNFIFQQVTLTPGIAHTFSVHVRRGDLLFDWIELAVVATSTWRAWFDVASGVKGTQENSPVSYDIEALDDDWFRIRITIIPDNTTCQFFISAQPADGNAVTGIDSDDAVAFHLFGAQLVEGTNPHPYYKTEAVAGSNELTLDDAIDFDPNNNYTLTVVLADGSLDEFAIVNPMEVTGRVVPADKSAHPAMKLVDGAGWVLADDDVNPRYFKILTNKQKEKAKFEIQAVEHDPTKFARVEQNIAIQKLPVTVLTGPIKAPVDLGVKEYSYKTGIVTDSAVTFGWRNIDPRAQRYKVWYQKPGEDYFTEVTDRVTEQSYTIKGVFPGTWSFQVMAIDAIGNTSPFAKLLNVTLRGLTGPAADITNFTGNVSGTSLILSWDPVDDLKASYYHMKFAHETTGATWGNSEILVERISLTTSSISVSAVKGSYFLKAVSETGEESVHAAVVVNTVDAVSLNAVVEVAERPTWGGAKTGMAPVGSNLELIGPTYPAQTAQYQFQDIADLIDLFTSRVTAHLLVAGVNVADTMDKWPVLQDLESLSGSDPESFEVGLKIRRIETQTLNADAPTEGTGNTEPASINYCYNSIASGAVVGVIGSGGSLPTVWTDQASAFASCTLEITAIEASSFLPGYNEIEFEISNTSGVTRFPKILFSENANNVAFAPSTGYVTSLWMKIISGAAAQFALGANWDSIPGNGSYVGEQAGTVVPTSEWQRLSGGGTTSAATNGISPYLNMILSDGQTCRFRIAAPQTEEGTAPTLPTALIPTTTNATVARSTDGAYVDGASQSGNTIMLAGLKPQETVLKQGDSIAIGADVYLVSRPVIPDYFGKATVQLTDNLASSPADLAAVTLGSPDNWTDWQQFIVGDYKARAYQFRIDIESFVSGINVSVQEATVNIDMPDRIEKKNSVPVDAAGTTIVFDPPFRATPTNAVTGVGLLEGDTIEVTNETNTSFDVRVLRGGGAVSGLINYVSVGFGYKNG